MRMRKYILGAALASSLLAFNGCSLRKTHQKDKELAGWEVLENLDKVYGDDYPDYVEGRYFDEHGTPVLQIRGDTLRAKNELAKAAGSNNFRLEQVGNGIYSQKELDSLLTEMRKRLDSTTDTALYINAFGSGREVHKIRVDLLRNTAEWRERFRKEIMDSPALEFDGPDGREVCELKGVSETFGVSLEAEQTVIPINTHEARFVLHNGSNDTIGYGSAYDLAYEQDGQWYHLPTDRFFTLELIEMLPEGQAIVSANLYPEVNRNRAGRYRFFKEISIRGQKEMLMAEFTMSAPTALHSLTGNTLSYEYELVTPDSAQIKPYAIVKMWTEKTIYPKTVETIDVYVYNPTDTPFCFGRRWELEVWENGKWQPARCKATTILCKDDQMRGNTTPETLCFRFPIGKWYELKEGKYRISKFFNGRVLSTMFEITP